MGRFNQSILHGGGRCQMRDWLSYDLGNRPFRIGSFVA